MTIHNLVPPVGFPADRRTVGSLIDSFALDTAYVGSCAQTIADLSQLPVKLQREAQSANRKGAWRAWQEGERRWFVKGRLALRMTRRLNRPVIHLVFCDTDGRPAASGLYCRASTRQWRLVRLLSAA